MPGLDLSDLGLDAEEEPTPYRPSAPAAAPTGEWLSLADAAREVMVTGAPGTLTLQRVLGHVGVTQATRLLRDALRNIYSADPTQMPSHALLHSLDSDATNRVEDLRDLLGVRLTPKAARRVLVLLNRHADRFLVEHPSWQGHLADHGTSYEEMERRALLGEFDLSGPLDSRFDLATMTFRL